jgi:hypothetical protein
VAGFEAPNDNLANPTVDQEKYLLEMASPFSSERCVANHAVAMVALANRDSQKAKHYFEQSTQTGKFDWWDHVWSEAFLKRMEDPQWPNWGNNVSP